MIYTISVRGKLVDKPVLQFLDDNFKLIPLDQIDSLFGFVEYSPFYGGRPFSGRQLSDLDISIMYANSIGLRLPLTNHFVSDYEYKLSIPFLDKYHRKGNSVIITEDSLAERIKVDFPYYSREASVIKNINTQDKITKALTLYDTVILPMHFSQDLNFLSELEPKSKITLFANSGCALNCPSKICYRQISKQNKFDGFSLLNTDISCSKYTVPRDSLGVVDFDLSALTSLGYNRFKLLRATPDGYTGY